MSGCPTHGALVGGYVLGALEPGEMEEMRRHLEVCPHCGPEARRLTALPGLLDRIEPADVPPPALSPQVEEAVLDRFARERREERREAPRTAAELPPEGAGAARLRGIPPRRPRRTARWIAALAGAGLAAIVLALALLWPSGGEDGERAYASAVLGGLAAAPGAGATAEVAEVPAGTHVRLRARGLPARGRPLYELWCVRPDGRWVSGGTFHADADGHAQAELTAGVRPGDYHVMVVTSRAKDMRERARGTPVLRGRLRY